MVRDLLPFLAMLRPGRWLTVASLVAVVALHSPDAAHGLEHLAGGGLCDGLRATEATVLPWDVAVDAAGTVFVTDRFRLRRVDPLTGVITTIAGPGHPTAPIAAIAMAIDGAGRAVIAAPDRLQRYDPVAARLEPLTADASVCRDQDDIPASEACVRADAVAIGPDGAIHAADLFGVRRIDPGSGLLTLESAGLVGDGWVSDVTVDGRGVVYVAFDGRIVRLARPPDAIRTVAGRLSTDRCPRRTLDVVSATGACILPHGLAVGAGADVVFADAASDALRVVDTDSGIMRAAAGPPGHSNAVDDAGNLYAATDVDVTRTDPGTRRTTRIAGNGSTVCGDGGPASSAAVFAAALAVDARGSILAAGRGRIRRIDSETGVITTIAGSDREYCGEPSDDPVPACGACLQDVYALAVGPEGDIYFSQHYEHDDRFIDRVRRISARTGLVTTVSGTCHREWALGEWTNETSVIDSCLSGSVLADGDRHLYISDGRIDRIVKVDLESGAGTEVSDGRLVGLDEAGGLFVYRFDYDVVDGPWSRVVYLDPHTDDRITIAGGRHDACSTEDGTPMTEACLGRPVGVDQAGNIVIVERETIRLARRATGRMETLARTACPLGPSQPSLECSEVYAAALGPGGRVVITDYERVFALDARTGVDPVLAAADVTGHAACPSHAPRECVHDGDCDDGDACTSDDCRGAVCVREPVDGRRGARCVLRDLRAVAACVEDPSSRLELRLARLVRTARRTFDRRRTGSSRALSGVEAVARKLAARVLARGSAAGSYTECTSRIVSRLHRLASLSRNLQDS